MRWLILCNMGGITMAQYKVKASVEFQFNVDLDNQTEEIAEMIDRIRMGEYFPRDVVNVTLDEIITVNDR